MNTSEPHFDFRLNGISFDVDELKEVGYSLIKEGEPYEQSLGDFLLDWLNDEPTISVKTSGSTGNPKIIKLQKEHMVNSALATGGFFDLIAGNSALLCIPTDFIAGKMMLVRAMVLGLALDCVEPSSRPLEFVSKQYDFCAMVPMQVDNSVDKINSIKTLIVGGAPISNYLQSKLQKSSCRIFETYGMTETSTHIAVKKVNHSPESTFRLLPDIKISQDTRDCLVIDAPKIVNEKITTNDVVKLISDSEFEWLGRADNVINSGGVKIFPEQIEAKLAPLMKNRFFLAGLPDIRLGEKLVLIIESEKDPKALSDTNVFLPVLEKYEMPKKVMVISKFIETGSGKINRRLTLEALKK